MTTPKEHAENKENKQHSTTKVHFSTKGAYKYVSGLREPISIRIDTGLYERFKPVAKRVFGSVCRAVELYIIALIDTAETGVHFSDTEQPIKIDKIVIERNLRPRRSLPFDERFAGLDFVKSKGCYRCNVSDVDLFRVQFISGLVANVCTECLKVYRGQTVVKTVLGRVSQESELGETEKNV